MFSKKQREKMATSILEKVLNRTKNELFVKRSVELGCQHVYRLYVIDLILILDTSVYNQYGDLVRIEASAKMTEKDAVDLIQSELGRGANYDYQ